MAKKSKTTKRRSSKKQHDEFKCPEKPDQPRTTKQALEILEAGNDDYVVDELKHCYEDVVRRVELAKIQEPFAVVLSCADSRVVPELIFGCGIGQIFVVRVAGNIGNVESIASIEYAVANLPVKAIIVLGHEDCGAVKAAMGTEDLGHNLNELLASSEVSKRFAIHKKGSTHFKRAK